MTVYKIVKKNKYKKIKKIFGDQDDYEFKPNIRNNKFIQINNLRLSDEMLIKKILLKKQENSFRRLTAICLSVLEDEDATSGDAIIALDEVARQKGIIIKKYQKYLKSKETDKMLKRLKVLEKDLKDRLIYLQEEEEKIYSR